jgi:sarcosine oxidase subunit gamma
MTDFIIEHRAALGEKKSSSFMGVKIEVLPEGHVLHALAGSADGDLSGAIRTALGLEALAVRFVTPGQWFIVGDNALSHAELTDLADRLKPMLDIVVSVSAEKRRRPFWPRVRRPIWRWPPSRSVTPR